MKHSLKRKTIAMFAAIGLLFGAISTLIYAKGITDITKEQYSQQSIDLTKTVAAEIEVERVIRLKEAVKAIYDKTPNVVLSDRWGTPEFDAYIALYKDIEKNEDFLFLRDHLRKIQDVNHVDCLYLTWIDTENECVIYLVDAAYEDACPPGCVDPLFGDQSAALKDPSVGLAPNITNTPEYGWIIATGMPVFDTAGNVVAYSSADISMNEIMGKAVQFVLLLGGVLLAMAVIVFVIGIIVEDRVIVKPINRLSEAAKSYATSKQKFADLNIKRKDEIGVLADSMVQMEEEIDGYIARLTKARDDLIAAQEQADQMQQAANIDALTSVRNKRAYDLEVLKLGEAQSEYGLVMIDLNDLKHINDSYGHEKGNAVIKKLCEIVCRIFKHSPVFRIGGDEFVVVLRNDDYNNREALIEEFESEIKATQADETLEPRERISAAIGCAVYDPATDNSVEDVFNRADKAMYENKNIMKSFNA
ncbi:MAG: GGDEF domain-containing protein [Clostridia bacterium]|nr:GGDEF domain-containing protein [Clostridia bacterium]